MGAVVRRVGFVLPSRFEVLDLAGPLEVFAAVEKASVGRFVYRIQLISLSGEPRCQGDLRIGPTIPFTQINPALDTLLIVGGEGALTRPSEAALRWLRSRARAARRFGSICTGAFVLAEAGLLEGRRAVTHWAYCQRLASRFPRIRVDAEPIFVRDGKCITSAGVSAGIDLALALVEEDCGSVVADRVARDLVLFLRRPGDQRQFTVALEDQQSTTDARFRNLTVWVTAHLPQRLSIPRLASVCGMSPRTFARHFVDEFGVTPKVWLTQMRVEFARLRLAERRASLKELARASGFTSTAAMRRAFLTHLGVGTEEYRERFGKRAGLVQVPRVVSPSHRRRVRRDPAAAREMASRTAHR